jgi:hemerythrin-like domain-containing protein
VKNVARTYSLEHEGESVLFDQLFELLNSNMQNEESYRRELASRTGALQTSIDQHMSKEEEQVFFFIGCARIALHFLMIGLREFKLVHPILLICIF